MVNGHPSGSYKGGPGEIDFSSTVWAGPSTVWAGATGRGRGGVILMYIKIGAPSTRPEARRLS